VKGFEETSSIKDSILCEKKSFGKIARFKISEGSELALGETDEQKVRKKLLGI
jgi:hypothetical protein